MVRRVESHPARANTLETARGVATLATAAQRLLQFALVYIGAYLPRRVHLVAAVADATIRAHEILAATVHANVRILCTLVDIIPAVSHSSTVWAQGVEFVGVWKWARLARGTPAHRLAQYYRAAATTRLRHRCRRRIRALAVPVLGVTQIPPCL